MKQGLSPMKNRRNPNKGRGAESKPQKCAKGECRRRGK